MWSQLIKVATMSKGALVVGIAASAAMVSNAEFSNTPSHNEVPSATPIVSTAPASSSQPANSPSSRVEPKKTDVPAAQLPASTTPLAPSAQSGLAHGEVPGVIRECVEKYLALREQGDSATTGERRSTGEVCRAALAVSGLSGAEFWAKFGSDSHVTAPKTTPGHSADLEAMIKECLAQRLAGTADQSDACHKAIAASGLTPQEFWTKFGSSTDVTKHELSADVLAWVRECVTKYSRKAADATATCKKAIELTGLTSGQFAERFLRTTGDTKPTTTPSTTRPATAEFEQLVYTCRKLQGAITDATPAEQVNAASALCDKAIAASGLGTAGFWNRWPAIKPTTTPTSTPKPVTNTAELSQLVTKCLDLYKTITSTGGDTKAASDACRTAIQASGLSSADFWAKYHPTTTTN